MENDKSNGLHFHILELMKALKMYFPKLHNSFTLLTLSNLVILNMEGLPQLNFFKNFDLNSLYTGHTIIKWNSTSMVDIQVLQNLLYLGIFLCLPDSRHKLCEDTLILVKRFLYNFDIYFYN